MGISTASKPRPLICSSNPSCSAVTWSVQSSRFMPVFIVISGVRAPRSDLRHVFPLAALGRVEHGVADRLRLEGLAEGRARRLAGGEALEEVGDLVDEGVLVADLEARHPP